MMRRCDRVLRHGVRAIVLLVLGAAVGCATSVGALPGGGPTASGVDLRMFVRFDDWSMALYRVRPGGTIGFGGATDALNNRLSWTGEMTADETRELRAMLGEHQWWTREPASTGTPPGRVYEITLTVAGGERRYRVIGKSDEVQPIHDFLEEVSRRRYGQFLERLPKAGPQNL